ncbi:type IV secretion protein Rhs [Citrobacter sp. NCU1]|uniref:type VI secretion system Vgr family protein n=1 Tax=Citrobacter sp. NCU1 TaxID=2026683 RepID=UPI001390C92E|nr:type VI secretion system tip protein VgrG [Citrobacter sp. NCU1]NDO80642.1 type IV secretion protein Rhs [Citrobacter sp. NCU1]
MSLTDTLNSINKTTLNRYQLNIPSCTSPLDVEEFSGKEKLSELYYYNINFTSTGKDIDATQVISKPATLTMSGGILQSLTECKRVHGVVTAFRRISSSEDQSTYQITLEPFLSLLDKQFRSHRFFVNKSVPEVVTQVLQDHALQGWEYEFNLKQSYPKREQINQYQESDLAFIQRLLAEVGIFYFFTLQKDAQTEVVHFIDARRGLMFDKKLAINSPSGMSDNGAESVWGLNVSHHVVEANVTTRDYNHREAQSVLQSVPADMTRGDGEGNTYGEVYHYRLRHLERGDKIAPSAETANFYARLDHERFLANQTRITGTSTDASLAPAQVVTITDSLPPTLPAVLQNPVLITGTGFTGSRKNALQVALLAVPYSETICWRPPLLPRPTVSGTLTARVTSAKANDIYAWQDASGLYRVKFDADRDDKQQGKESMPVRLAKPYGGDVYGFHFPLIQGTEVAIAFHEGDPDRPYIAHALHDSRHVDHVTEKNSTRNIIRTAGLNKLRMEDKRGEEHIKLSTEYGGKTQLNLGHNVDASRALRGEGAELRTDDWVSIRGGKGIFISADNQSKAQGQMLDMNAAIAQLQGALQLVTTLAQSASVSGASEADTGSQQQLGSILAQLKGAGLLASAPEGIGLVTPQNIQLSAGHTLTATAGENVDMGIMKKLTVAAGEAISLFAQKMGVKLFAARGMVDIQAQTDAMRLQSDKAININSISGEIVLNAAQGITLTSKGGAYIKIKDGAVEIGAPGKIDMKSASILWGGNASLEQVLSPMSVSDPEFHNPMNGGFQVLDQSSNQPKPYIPYRIETEDGQIIRGATDENGYTQSHYGIDPKSIKMFFE